jgi:hypothetical protein
MLAFISWLIGLLQTRSELELEVIALRHQPGLVLTRDSWFQPVCGELLICVEVQ